MRSGQVGEGDRRVAGTAAVEFREEFGDGPVDVEFAADMEFAGQQRHKGLHHAGRGKAGFRRDRLGRGATSAQDPESERLIQKALKQLMWGRTTIVVAHRMATIRDADVIHVLDNGKVVESGSHDDLILEPNLYARLHDLQMKPEAVAS